MVRPSGRRGDADLGPVTDMTTRVEGRPVTASSRGLRGRHSTSDIPVTPTPLAPGFHHGTGEAGSSTQPPAAPTVVRPRIPYRSAIQEPILYDGSQPRQIGVEFFYQMLGAARQDSSCSTYGYSHAEYGVSSSDPCVLGPADREETDERGDDDGDGGDGDCDDSDGGDDDGDGGDDDHNDSDDNGDEEQPVYVASVAPVSGSDGRPRHGKGKGLTGSLMSVMSKFAGSRNKRPDVVCDVPAPTQKRKKVKPSDWE
ncbi:hypothetical protein M9H77_32244 [Catharanthus roseus]|uniref:Uncharacterized protein n=1 Tax=Catharanthus roseus TaxID=4058 RepID=A0ACC0A3M1_CATRO|nr:hypothetical protein M9H77_32244 [Catharanthus roseus]